MYHELIHIEPMIRSFKDKDTRQVFDGICPKGFPTTIFKTARRKLRMIHNARLLDDLKVPPGNKLHALERERAGQHAIRINDQYRVCFMWTPEGPIDVEITDYHD
jgi:proteic killer suppression protein